MTPTRIRVLQSFRTPRPTTNPYLVQVLSAAPDEIEMLTFSWSRAVLGRYDVLHLHWPENLLRSRRTSGRIARYVLTAALVARCALLRTAVVQTVHNHRPHESGPAPERMLLGMLDRRVTARIALNEADAGPGATLVRHGHYRDWYAGTDVPAAERGRAAFVGLVRPYKNVEHLLVAFAGLDDAGARLHVAGSPSTEELAASLRRLASEDDRVELRLAHLSEAEVADAVGRSCVVVLPYAEMNNSGAALLALSLDRPVLVPDALATRALAAEVGDAWVRRFVPPLTADDLAAALDAGPPGGRPDLDRREWPAAGRAHAEVYAAARAAARRA